MRVIEFQKRGLPHAHMLIILVAEEKFKKAEDVDRSQAEFFPQVEEVQETLHSPLWCTTS